MWTVFSRCAGSLEEGRRLENLSWRLWNRETFCCESGHATPAMPISTRSSEGHYSLDMPELSGSVESLVDEDAIEFESDSSTSTTPPLDIAHPRIERQDSVCSRSRGRERHITPDELEKMVINIQEKKNLERIDIDSHYCVGPSCDVSPLESDYIKEHSSPATSEDPTVESTVGSGSTSGQSCQTAASDCPSAASERSTTSVVRGFSPSHVSSSYRSIPLLSIPSSSTEDVIQTNSKPVPPKKQQPMFALGGSSGEDSANEPSSSMEQRMKQQATQHTNQQAKKKATVFELGGSSEADSSLRSNTQSFSGAHRSFMANNTRNPSHSKQNSLMQNKKQTSFREEVASRTILEEAVNNDVFETDDEDIDESAIDDDDDSSDWEDSLEDSGKSSIDDKTFFQRVDSRPNLVSRRSLITTMLHQNERSAGFRNQAASMSTPAMQRSRKSSPNGPSLIGSPESDDAAPLMMKKAPLKTVQEAPRSGAQPIIMTTTNTTAHQAALSPRTTRRNMLSTELTESLRRHLLWERQQKNQTASAVLKRRHTSNDVANLKQYPEKVHMGKAEDKDGRNGSWNETFGSGLGEYHSKGW
eukprot:GHVU01123225.1.p1 GENE.GHVU01123225.1~~GHVU01123225.1.p1  ORF type:complete len:619 (-),score=66.61 GHVU01123225.1:675-2432(-)